MEAQDQSLKPPKPPPEEIAAARRSSQGLKAAAGADRSAGRGFEAAGQTLGGGLQRDRRSVGRALNHIRQIEQQRSGPERDYGPSR